MRKNKTYDQQKKYYDGSNEYESLLCIGLNAATRPQHPCRRPTESATESARSSFGKTSTTFVTTKELSIEKRSTSSLESSTLARSKKPQRSANRGAISRSIRETAQV